ncbi:hypothetical protein [Pseudarthrobacter sp. B4EP4b]|uniref:hypothetical protein n=1 Tax=Pseudarthrobacter sp. B4EP4b TaxID=2590664 RepID=UPI0011540BD6|nr:hypothetical protein [Pseudarthrobacter sp. B4EP4b]
MVTDPAIVDRPADGKPADGGFQAMDQLANWVRFADTKATILTAGLGVFLTMLISNSRTILEAVGKSHVSAAVVSVLAVGTLLAVGWTLFWLVRAIGPQNKVFYARLNRFAWPSLVRATAEQLLEHTSQKDVRADAWQQVLDLSVLADRKFSACGKAVNGFAALVLFGTVCVGVSMLLTAV